jgi:hypothetical protein
VCLHTAHILDKKQVLRTSRQDGQRLHANGLQMPQLHVERFAQGLFRSSNKHAA